MVNACSEKTTDVSGSELEIKKHLTVLQADVSVKQVDKFILYYSSWYRLKKAVVWWLKIKGILLLRSRNELDKVDQYTKSSITVEELIYAEQYIVMYVQGCVFAAEIKQISSTGQVDTSSNLHKLCPTLVNGLLFVGGRLRRSSLDDSAKHPVILPKLHHIVVLIVNRYHIKSRHSA